MFINETPIDWKELPISVKDPNDILAYCLCEDANQFYKLKCLNEAAKEGLVKQLVSSISKYIRSHSNSLDFREIDKSKGDMINIKSYQAKKDGFGVAFDKVYGYLSQQRSGNSAPADIFELRKYILSKTKIWKQAYQFDQNYIITLYRTLCQLWFMAVSTLLANCVIYNSDENRLDYKLAPRLKNSYTIHQVQKMNQLFATGKIDKYIETATNKSIIQEKHTMFLGESITFVGALAGIAFAIVAFLTVLVIIRELIFSFFLYRRKIAGELKIASEYLKLEANLANSQESKEDKEKLAERFISLSDKVNFGQDSIEQQSIKEAIQQEKLDAEIMGGKDPQVNVGASNYSNNMSAGVLL